jgi:hypothetical protein
MILFGRFIPVGPGQKTNDTLGFQALGMVYHYQSRGDAAEAIKPKDALHVQKVVVS